MMNFTNDEMNLMCIYDTGKRTGLICELEQMKVHLAQEESELREMTDSVISKLHAMTDEQYTALELIPDFDEEEPNAQ